jgi:hypothetical protein
MSARKKTNGGTPDARKLKVYDQLREAHCHVKKIYIESLVDESAVEEVNALDAVNSVLYMAEAIFARMSD